MENYYGFCEAAKELGIGEKQLYHYIANGEIKAVPDPNSNGLIKFWVVKKEDLERFRQYKKNGWENTSHCYPSSSEYSCRLHNSLRLSNALSTLYFNDENGMRSLAGILNYNLDQLKRDILDLAENVSLY